MVWLHVWMEDGVSVDADEGRGCPFSFFISFITCIYKGDEGMKGSQERGWNTGRLMSIMSDCPSVLCLWPAGLISQSCHYCSVSVHWNSTSTFTVGNTHLSSGFLRAALKKKRKHFEYPVCAVLLLLLTIFLTDRGLAAFISQYFIILVLFILRDFYFIVRHVFTLRCLQYVKYKGDLYSDLWKPLCVCYRGVERLF